uniref:Protein kinase domain-containing protein n=1 Tax=Pelagomonas calceolata TaxID=35677 RepID=A0A7S4EAV5_9STRA
MPRLCLALLLLAARAAAEPPDHDPCTCLSQSCGLSFGTVAQLDLTVPLDRLKIVPCVGDSDCEDAPQPVEGPYYEGCWTVADDPPFPSNELPVSLCAEPRRRRLLFANHVVNSAYVVTGDLAFDGITYETALASVDVFVAAVASLCGVDESAVSVVISQARRRHLSRRRLDDGETGSVKVEYTVAVETEAAAASVSTLMEDSSTEDVSAAVKKAATEAGADEDFADVETTAVGTPTTALAPQPDGDAPATTASEGSSGGGGGPDAAMSAGIGAVGAVVLLALFGGGVVWRRRRAKAALRRGGEAAALQSTDEGYDPKTREALLQRHKDTTAVVERGMTVTSALLGAASGLPLVRPLCDVAKGILGDVEEFSEKADDVLVAARRVIDVLDVVDLMSKNVSKCSDGKDIAQANMQRLIDLLKEFHAAVRAFGQKGWLKRAFTMQSHVKKLGLIDKRIVEQLGVFRLSYRLAIDSQMMERTYQIEQSIAALVAKRVVEKGESEEAAAAALSEDAVAITSVAVDARVPPTEIAVEMREFRLEVKEGLSKLDKKMNKMLDGRTVDKQQLKSILVAVKAGVGRDEKLMAAVQAGAARDKRILAAIEAGNERNASIRRNVHELGGALRKTKSRELVKRMKEAALGQSELELEDVEELPFAEGGQGAVFRGYLGGEIVCLKKISMVGVPALKRTKMLSSFKTELGIMIRLRHPRTVQVLGVVTTNPSFLGLVMEYLPGGSLRHALDRDDEVITPEYQRFWTADVALGMAHLYSCKIEHRDLKTHNVLLTHDGRCKVTDFGLSRCEELKTFTTTATMRDSAAGTPAFMAPELFEDNTFTEKSDVYSYAVVLWEIYDRGIPWAGLKPQQILYKLIKEQRLDVPKSMPRDLSSLMERAWAQDPDARPSFADICKELQATTPRRPSSISRPWSASSPTAGDAPPPASVASGQGSSRSLASSVMNMFRAAQSDEAAAKSPADARPAQAGASSASPAVKGGAEAAKNNRINTVFEPMRTWYGAPARAALKKTHGAYPATPEALANWKSFGPVTTAFLDDQGVAPGPTATKARTRKWYG